MEIKWHKLDELPMDEPSCKKMLILSSGKKDDDKFLYVNIDYWHVFFDNREFTDEIRFNKKKFIDMETTSYGSFIEGNIPFDKIKGWMYADDLIQLYNNGK